MALEYIDVIDSAVKIGLGAAIAAYASYKGNKANHSNERDRELRTHKIKVIETIAEKSDRFINSYSNLMHKFNYVFLSKRKIDDEYSLEIKELDPFREADKEFLQSLESMITASSRLSLLRADNAETRLNEVRKLAVEMRNAILVERKAPSKTIYQEYQVKWKDSVKNYQKELADFYNKI